MDRTAPYSSRMTDTIGPSGGSTECEGRTYIKSCNLFITRSLAGLPHFYNVYPKGSNRRRRLQAGSPD